MQRSAIRNAKNFIETFKRIYFIDKKYSPKDMYLFMKIKNPLLESDEIYNTALLLLLNDVSEKEIHNMSYQQCLTYCYLFLES